jgi:hypothetical protein
VKTPTIEEIEDALVHLYFGETPLCRQLAGSVLREHAKQLREERKQPPALTVIQGGDAP